MPRQPIHNYWRERVKSEIAKLDQGGRRVTDAAIHRAVKQHAEELKEHDDPQLRALADSYPSVRSVGRIRDEWKETPEAKRAQYRKFYWPESMEQGDLPWEASASALELLRLLDADIGLRSPSRQRPPIRAVRWFWRVSQAIPDAPFGLRMEAAAKLMVAEDTGNGNVVRGVEGELAYGPWRSKEVKEMYLKATERSFEPLPGNPRGRMDELSEAGIGYDALNFLGDALVISRYDRYFQRSDDIVETTDQKEAQNGETR